MTNSKAVALAIGLIFLNLASHCYGAGLQYGFYKGKCRNSDVEDIVRKVVISKFKDRSIAPALIRMQFHDCFVNGCDASILLDGANSEKTAPPNLSVRGYNVIDAAKDAVEKVCPGVVSCADIIIMATRDVVSLSGGGKYNVQTGRRDGLVSLAQNTRSLPGPSISVANAIKAFASKGLTATDMIYLLGGHTIGVTHCSLFQDRLYNFQNTRKPDPTMDKGLLKSLRVTCPQNSTANRAVNLDQNPLSSNVVDKSFYNQIMKHRGILQIDQELALDRLSKSKVAAIASSWDFNAKFGQAMVKMGAIQVLTGTQGQIRKSCHVINPKTTPLPLPKVPITLPPLINQKGSPPPPKMQPSPPPKMQSPPPPKMQPQPPPNMQSPPPSPMMHPPLLPVMQPPPPPPMMQPPPSPMMQSPPPPMMQPPPPPKQQLNLTSLT